MKPGGIRSAGAELVEVLPRAAGFLRVCMALTCSCRVRDGFGELPARVGAASISGCLQGLPAALFSLPLQGCGHRNESGLTCWSTSPASQEPRARLRLPSVVCVAPSASRLHPNSTQLARAVLSLMPPNLFACWKLLLRSSCFCAGHALGLATSRSNCCCWRRGICLLSLQSEQPGRLLANESQEMAVWRCAGFAARRDHYAHHAQPPTERWLVQLFQRAETRGFLLEIVPAFV